MMNLNSGDWVQNPTPLEYNQGQWKVFDFNTREVSEEEGSSKKLFTRLLSEFDVISRITSFK